MMIVPPGATALASVSTTGPATGSNTRRTPLAAGDCAHLADKILLLGRDYMCGADPTQGLPFSAGAGRGDRRRPHCQGKLNRCYPHAAGSRRDEDVLARLKRSDLDKSAVGREVLHPNGGEHHAADVAWARHYGVYRNKDF